MFTYKTQIHLHDTDAAGLIFFANQFKIIHDAYESLLEKFGWSFAHMLKKSPYFLPIVHAECDYKKPLFVGDKIKISVAVEHIGTTSFTFTYVITNSRNICVGTGKTVHVIIHKKTSKKTPLPPSLRRALENYYAKRR